MDVIRFALIAVFTASLTGCGEHKRSSAMVANVSPQCASTAINNQYIVEWEDGHFTVEKSPTRQQFIEKFIEPNIELIKRAEADQMIQIKSDPAVAEETVPANWGQTVSQAEQAWDKNVYGKGVTVAVIDSGIDFNHPQLKNQIAVNPNEVLDGVDNDGNGYIDDISGWNFSAGGLGTADAGDDNGHGTHLSGIIAAEHSLGVVKGIAPQAKILPLKFMAADGSGSVGRAIMAIDYAAAMNVRTINASWGTGSCSTSLESAITRLSEKNVLFIAAAGNDHSDLTMSPSFPAAFGVTNQITVGALTYNGFRADFSNYGALVHLVAPGTPIYSTLPLTKRASGYDFMSGTSMAAPFVAGAAALLWSYKPSAAVSEIRDAILHSVFVKDHLNVATHGQLDIGAALTELDKRP
jgi:subtilisin family serine protease